MSKTSEMEHIFKCRKQSKMQKRGNQAEPDNVEVNRQFFALQHFYHTTATRRNNRIPSK